MTDAANAGAYVAAVKNSEADYCAKVAQLLDYWRGVHLPGLRAYLSQTFADPKNMNLVLTAANITGAVIRKRAMAYAPGPARVLLGTSEAEGAAYAALVGQTEWDERLAAANAISVLAGVAAVRLAFTAGGRVVLHVEPPNLWRGHCAADDPTQLTAYFFVVRGAAGFVTVGWTAEFQFWRHGNCLEEPWRVLETTATYDAADLTKPHGRTPNRYGQIPVVLVYDRAANQLRPPPDDVLLALQNSVNLTATGGMLNLKHQGFTQWASRNLRDAEGAGVLLAGPDKIMDLGMTTGDGPPEIFTINPDSKTAEHVAWLDELWLLAAHTYDIHPNVLRGDVQAPSGVALALMQAPLYQNQRRQQNRFNHYEARLFELLKTILAVEPAAFTLPAGAALRLDWPEPLHVHDPLEKWELAKAQMDAGLLSPVEFLQAQNPDMSQAEAVERLQRIRADLAQFPAQEIALPELGI